MDLEIGKKLPVTHWKNSYNVELEWHHGGDKYTSLTESYDFDKTKDLDILEEYLNLCKLLLNTPSYKYREVEGYKKWFNSLEYEYEKEDYQRIRSFVEPFGERDAYDEDALAQLISYKVYYYDNDYRKYDVKIKNLGN